MFVLGLSVKLINTIFAGVHVYRIERSSQNVGKIRSPWVIKRIRGRITELNGGEMIASRLKFEADILR